MRKIIAFVLCSVFAFILGFSFLPESSNLLVGWFGPGFGTPLHVILSMIFILMRAYLISGVPAAWSVLQRTINKIPSLEGKGLQVLTLASLAIIVPLAILEIRNLRISLKTRK